MKDIFKIKAVLAVGFLAVSTVSANFDGLIVESDYYQLDPANQARDQRVLDQKENLASNTARVLGHIAEIDAKIHEIDADLARYSAPEARNILLAERRKLFQKRKEYLALSAAYTQQQTRMTRDLTQSGVQAGLQAGGQGFTIDGSPTGGTGVDTPNWRRQETSQAKPFIRVEKEKNMKELAEVLSKRIYGEFNQDIYVELLSHNFNHSINPQNLMAGDIVFLPHKIAMLTVMGIQEKQLLDVTMALITEIKDADLRRKMIRYAAEAEESKEARKAFTEVLIALKMHGENSNEFKTALTNYHRVHEVATRGGASQMLVTEGSFPMSRELRDKVVVVSNASLQLDMLPRDVAEKVRDAARKYRAAKDAIATSRTASGSASSASATAIREFETSVNVAYEAVENYRRNGGAVATDRFRIEEDVTGTRSSANARVGMTREVREMNRVLLQIVQDTVDILGTGWTAEGTWWENLTESNKKEATRKLFELTNVEVETSRVSQVLNRLKLVYANVDRYSVDMYSDSEFSSLRKSMISLVGMAMAIKAVQPSWWRSGDGKFRDLNSSAALRRLGIDPDKKMFMDRGTGAKPQFEDLMEGNTAKISQATGLRTQWLSGLSSVAALSASFADQDRLSTATTDARKFFEELSEKMDRGITGTLLGTGLGAGATGLTLLAVSNFWNPVGWVAAGIVGGGAVIGLAVGNTIDQNQQVAMIQRYGNVKVIAELGVHATEPGKIRLVEGMLYFDELVKGY
ncbi:MAG: hypothetical protein H3C47_05490 [Candidatus Cloacimonetes bacterium]|nr:hypothetical protein [Candidatus Cloacimonadota bacterium]